LKNRVLSFGSLHSPLARNQNQVVVDLLKKEGSRCTCEIETFPSPLGEEANSAEVFHAAGKDEIAHLFALMRRKEFRLTVVEAADIIGPLPEDLQVLCVPDRLNPFDAYLNRQGAIMDEMAAGSKVGVLTARSRAQMAALWPDLEFLVLSGGVDRAMETHMRRNEIDGLVLPAAVTELLGIQSIVAEIFSPEFILPGPGQGILLIVGMAGDEEARQALAPIHSQDTFDEYKAELAFRSRMIQDRDVPVGALARAKGHTMVIVGGTGSAANRISVDGPRDQAEAIGAGLATQILRDIRSFADLLEAEFPEGLDELDDLEDADDLDLDADGTDEMDLDDLLDDALEDDLGAALDDPLPEDLQDPYDDDLKDDDLD
jgi:hydroxymethylbilane synthase